MQQATTQPWDHEVDLLIVGSGGGAMTAALLAHDCVGEVRLLEKSDRYYGDRAVQPNPCLLPIEKPPYYRIEVHAGELGTKGGLRVDAKARVLGERGGVVEGPYAIGNCSSPPMGPTCAGAGATLGPTKTFGFIAAQEAVPEGSGG